MKIKEPFIVLKRVFQQPKYLGYAVILGFLFYIINGLIANIKNFPVAFKLFNFADAIKFLFYLSLVFINGTELFTAIGIIFLSILIGALISLLIYRVKTFNSAQGSFFGFMGIFLGILAPGCATCGIGAVAILGLSSALLVLPFKGKEVILLALVFVIFSIIKVAGKLYNPVCEIEIKKDERRENDRREKKYKKRYDNNKKR